MSLEATEITIIESGQPWWRIPYREIWNYRDLLWLLVRRDFVSKYKQTVLGPAWAVIQPLAMTVVFTIIFSRVAKISTDGAPPMLFYLAGLLCWNFFAQGMQGVGGSLRAQSGILGKVYFPRMIAPLSALLSALIPFLIQLGTFIFVYIYFLARIETAGTIGMGVSVCLFPLLILQAGLIALGVGLLLCALTVKYRDLQHVLGFLVQIWMYATPIIYPVSSVPDRWQWLVWLNPMSVVTEGTKSIFLGTPFPGASAFLIAWSVTAAALAIGIIAFQKVERSFVDVI